MCILVPLYKQTTTSKRNMLLAENAPQAALALLGCALLALGGLAAAFPQGAPACHDLFAVGCGSMGAIKDGEEWALTMALATGGPENPEWTTRITTEADGETRSGSLDAGGVLPDTEYVGEYPLSTRGAGGVCLEGCLRRRRSAFDSKGCAGLCALPIRPMWRITRAPLCGGR